jgi:hypothetical protein
LSAFVQTGLATAYVSISRNTPEERDLLQIYIMGEMMKGALNFRIFMGISSYPHVVLVFRDLIIILIS